MASITLWHFTSDILKGFYASEVYAIGKTKKEALLYAGEAFDNWAKTYRDDMGYWPLVNDYFNEEGKADAQLAEIRQAFLREAEAKFTLMGRAAILTRS